MQDNERPFNWRVWEILRKMLNPRDRQAGEGKHYKGKRKPDNYRATLKAKRKAERKHRRRVYLQAKGRKHRMRG